MHFPKLTLALIACIFFLSLFLRLDRLSQIPMGFHIDELTAGYVGLHIMQTGKDIYGNILPLYFNSFGDFRPTGIFYLSGMSSLLFGLNEFSVRLPAAFFGSVGVLGIYFLATEFFKNKRIGLISSLLLAVLPWHIVLSRATSEGVIGITLCIWGLYFLYKFQNKSVKKYLVFACTLFLISMFFYHPFRIIVPLLFIPFLITKPVKKGVKKLFLFSFLFFLVTVLFIASQKWGSGRLSQVAFYNNPGNANLYNNLYADERGSPSMEIRFFHNKITLTTRSLIAQIFSHTSPEYLFMHGGIPDRYVVPEQGLLYLFFFPFLLLTLINTKENKKHLYYLYYLFLIGLLPAVVTYEDTPNVHRSIFLIVPLVLLTAFGIDNFLSWKTKQHSLIKKLLVLGLICISVYEVLYFWHQYTIHAPRRNNFARNDGNKELVQFLGDDRGHYDKVFVPYNDQLPIYYLFFTDTNYHLFKTITTDPDIAFQIDNVYFVRDWCATKIFERRKFDLSKKYLLVDAATCRPSKNYIAVHSVDRTDGTVAFEMRANR